MAKELHRFQHNNPPKTQQQPHPHVPPNYGTKTQYATPPDDSKPLDKEGNKLIMQVTGKFLYYARAVNGKMLAALSAITPEKLVPVKRTTKK